MIRAGDYRHQITIQVHDTDQDSSGQFVNDWFTYATVRAAVMRTPGREVWASGHREGRLPVVFRIRYLAGVVPAMRVLFDSKVHNLLSVHDPSNGLKEELILTTEEITEAAP
jgi:SPP1 family predicted phage head-tail adaptor